MLMMRPRYRAITDGGDQLEVAREHQQLYPVPAEQREPGSLRRLSQSTRRPESAALSRDRVPEPSGRSAPGRLPPVRRAQRVQQRFEIAAAARDGHGYPHGHGRGS